MECRATARSLSDYLDGWISADEARSVEAHLTGCPACRSLKMELTEMKNAARELPLHTPSKAMWARIINEIEADRSGQWRPAGEDAGEGTWWEKFKSRRFSFSLPQLAGAGALAVAVAVFGYTSMDSPGQAGGRLNLAGARTAVLPDEDQLIREFDRRMATINARKASWDPQMRADFESQMNRIDQSLSKCRQMLNEKPDDKVHQEMVRSLHKEKIQLVNDVERFKW